MLSSEVMMLLLPTVKKQTARTVMKKKTTTPPMMERISGKLSRLPAKRISAIEGEEGWLVAVVEEALAGSLAVRGLAEEVERLVGWVQKEAAFAVK